MSLEPLPPDRAHDYRDDSAKLTDMSVSLRELVASMQPAPVNVIPMTAIRQGYDGEQVTVCGGTVVTFNTTHPDYLTLTIGGHEVKVPYREDWRYES